VLRVSVSNFSTDDADVAFSVDAVRAAFEEVAALAADDVHALCGCRRHQLAEGPLVEVCAVEIVFLEHGGCFDILGEVVVAEIGIDDQHPFFPQAQDVCQRLHQRRMRLAMIFGRPLPPRLARTAVEYAPALRNQAWLGYLLVATGVLYAAGALVEIIKHASPWWEWAGHEVLGAVWLTVGGLWFRVTRRAGRAAREGYWPERTGEDE